MIVLDVLFTIKYCHA